VLVALMWCGYDDDVVVGDVADRERGVEVG
jgi:hypothetical protein